MQQGSGKNFWLQNCSYSWRGFIVTKFHFLQKWILLFWTFHPPQKHKKFFQRITFHNTSAALSCYLSVLSLHLTTQLLQITQNPELILKQSLTLKQAKISKRGYDKCQAILHLSISFLQKLYPEESTSCLSLI